MAGGESKKSRSGSGTDASLFPADYTNEDRASTAAGSAGPADTAAYICDMLDELRLMADRAGLSFLGYMLELAREEAKAQRSRCF